MPRALTTITLVTLIAATASGCAVKESALARIADGTNRICAMTPTERDLTRAQIDQATYPHTVRLTCAEQEEDSDDERL